MSHYVGARIVNIHWGSGGVRSSILYAELVDRDGNLLISARLDYIVAVLQDRMP